MSKTTKITATFLFFAVVIIYAVTHLFKLTYLPVFADESIYIRWAQLIIDDWRQYLFFPLNDGKTPLFMWLLVPFQFIFSDQLFAGRFVSVLVGLVQVWLNWRLVKLLGGQKKAQTMAVFLTMILPFWFFHHRMALIDGLLTLFLSGSLYFLIRLAKKPQVGRQNYSLILQAGLFFGLSLLTKLPAVLFLPVFILLNLLRLHFQPKKLEWLKSNLQIGSSALVGLVIFISLKLHPAFGQLFSRGSDFLYPWSEFRQNMGGILWLNAQSLTASLTSYLTFPVLLIAIIGPFFKKNRWLMVFLLLSALAWLGPMFILGKVVYARYLLPAGLFITIAAALGSEAWCQKLAHNNVKKLIFQLILFVGIVYPSANFIWQSYFNVNDIPFTRADQVQYLEEWSAGFGVPEAVTLIKQLAQNRRVCVLTEGFFGTLPDAILLYFHRQDVSQLTIEGIGQPVAGIPDWAIEKARSYDQTILIVNSHRLKLPTEKQNQITLIREDCRPHQAPCQQIWDVTALITASATAP